MGYGFESYSFCDLTDRRQLSFQKICRFIHTMFYDILMKGNSFQLAEHPAQVTRVKPYHLRERSGVQIFFQVLSDIGPYITDSRLRGIQFKSWRT